MIDLLWAIATAGILGLLGFLIRIVVKSFVKHDDSHALLQEANKIQIQATLLFMFRHANDNGRSITMNELSLFKNLYKVYKDLGGNDFIELVNEKMNKMVISTEDE